MINTEHPLKPNVMRRALQMHPNDKNATEETERSQDKADEPPVWTADLSHAPLGESKGKNFQVQ